MINDDKMVLEQEKLSAIRSLMALPTRLLIPTVSDSAEQHRYLRAGVAENYGRWKKRSVPHLIEIMDRLHPDDPCTKVSVMKSVQAAVTVSVGENAMLLWLRYQLGSVFYLTSNQKIGKIRGSSAIDTMIDDSGMADLVKPMSQRVKQKKSDSSNYKEFEGGIKLQISSYGSIGDMKSNTFQLIICDEWDEAPMELADQGDIAGIIEGRTMAARTYKILELSTPSRAETSRIYRSFLEGDQRQYFVPCPYCGETQVLELKKKDSEYGLTFTREKSKETGQKVLIPETVRYICKHCGKDIYESKKQWMLENGVWIPQAKPENPKKHSYHASGLISPFLPWERICQRFIDTGFGENLLLFKDFTINYLGNPWEAVKRSLPWEELRDRADDYVMGTVPEGRVESNDLGSYYSGPLVLFGGVDVQGDRLELQVVGFGYGMEGWCIDFKVFYGKPGDPGDYCWIALNDFVRSHTYKICGQDCSIILTAVDSGYDPRKAQREHDFGGKANIVYDFVAENDDKFIAIMGLGDDKGISVLQEARINDPACRLKKRYNVYVALVKEMIMARIEDQSGRGAVHMPRYQKDSGGQVVPTSDEHFRRFLSERYQELPGKPGQFGWKKIYKRNEQWDTWIYAYAAAEFHNVPTWGQGAWWSYYEGLVGD